MYQQFNGGWIEVITGPMFSGKSEELIRRIKNLGHAQVKTLVIKPQLDQRWDLDQIISRSGSSIKTISVANSQAILTAWDAHFEAIAIDEVQFFDDGIVEVVQTLANQGKRVIVSGLDNNYWGAPFMPMAQIIAVAEFVQKQKAVCFVCKKAASFSYKKTRTKQSNVIALGDLEYEARCRRCFNQAMHAQT